MRKKVLEGWTYADDDFTFQSISAWSDSPQGIYFVLLKNKKDLGKFAGKHFRITIEELPTTKTRRDGC